MSDMNKESPVQVQLPADADVEKIMQKTAAYIEQVQPLLDKHADEDDRFTKRASQIAGILVGRGIIAQDEVDTLLQKLAADKTKALDLVAKLAQLIGADGLGKAAENKQPAGRVDGFTALVLTGDPTNTDLRNPPMVD